MALNKVYEGTAELNRERPVPAGTLAGVPLLIGGRPVVTITARGDAMVTEILPGGETLTRPVGGFANADDSATVAYDGTYELNVTGATTTTANDVEVFITSTGALTLTNTGNKHYGWTDYPRDYFKRAAIAAVRIGD